MNLDNNYPYIPGLAKSIFTHMKYKLRKYDEGLLEEAVTANVSRKDFNAARTMSIYKAERINNERQ